MCPSKSPRTQRDNNTTITYEHTTTDHSATTGRFAASTRVLVGQTKTNTTTTRPTTSRHNLTATRSPRSTRQLLRITRQLRSHHAANNGHYTATVAINRLPHGHHISAVTQPPYRPDNSTAINRQLTGHKAAITQPAITTRPPHSYTQQTTVTRSSATTQR